MESPPEDPSTAMVLYQGPPTVDRTSIESTDNENMAADDRIIKHSWCSEIIPFARYPSQNIPRLQQWSPGSAYTDQNELPISRPIKQEDHSRHIAAIKNESDDSISLSCSNFKQEGNFDQLYCSGNTTQYYDNPLFKPGKNLSILQASKTAISSELPLARDMSAHKSLLNWRIPLHSSRNKRKDLSDEEDVYDEQKFMGRICKTVPCPSLRISSFKPIELANVPDRCSKQAPGYCSSEPAHWNMFRSLGNWSRLLQSTTESFIDRQTSENTGQGIKFSQICDGFKYKPQLADARSHREGGQINSKLEKADVCQNA
ncbi:hypothetical protein WAI453_008308 [Rhynchosporium graminicola]